MNTSQDNKPTNMSAENRAQVLIEALPYLQQFSGKTVVIKYGGNAMTNPMLINGILQDIALLKSVGIRPVVVHGGGPEINKLLEKLEIESRFHNGLRVTDASAMEVVQMSLCGKLNKEIVAKLGEMGVQAVGLCGQDAGLIRCEKLNNPDGVDLGYVGEITEINAELLNLLAGQGYIPVVAPVGVGAGNAYNINADTAAAEIAAALGAQKLVYLTDIDGVRSDVNDPDSLIHALTCAQVRKRIADGTINGGMIPKVMGCVNAVERGVNRVHIVNGTVPHALLLEMLTDVGVGTMFSQDE